MNSPSSDPLRSSRSSSGRSSRSASGSGRLVKVKCSFCGNTFYASPREARCRKCNRPANRPLALGLRLAALVVPLFGFGYSAWIRPHSPLAAIQGVVASLLGTAIYGAIYAFKHLL